MVEKTLTIENDIVPPNRVRRVTGSVREKLEAMEFGQSVLIDRDDYQAVYAFLKKRGGRVTRKLEEGGAKVRVWRLAPESGNGPVVEPTAAA